MNIVAIPAITVCVYLIIKLLKHYIKADIFRRLIPPICCLLGAGIGLAIFFWIPNYLPAENWFVALIIGAVSGATATAANQTTKQLDKLQESIKASAAAVPEIKFDVEVVDTSAEFTDGILDDADDEH